MDDWASEGDDLKEDSSFFLGGGAVVAGVDYEAAWLEARAAATELNLLLGRLELRGVDLVRAQAGWSDDGQGVVFMEGTLSGARKLWAVLDRMLVRGEFEPRQPS